MKTIALLILLSSCGDRANRFITEPPPEPCSVTSTENGALIECPSGEPTLVKNGEDGVDATPSETVELVEICPKIEGNHIETLVKVGSSFMAFLTSGDYKKQRLTILPEDRVLESTDNRGIRFKIVAGELEYISTGCEE